ncbi:MAG: hypothetical protein LBL09_03985 [Oscillospiraceae bacterium]|jgi:MGT family glycosyltransferase|nr:hypothetical protein [Oscillospiraceae bacterium]
MSKVLFFHFFDTGHINPTIPLINELTSKGEEIICYIIHGTEIKFNNMNCEIKYYDERINSLNADLHLKVKNFVDAIPYWYKINILLIPEAIDEIRKQKPDYIIFDSLCYWAKAAADATGIPNISSSTIFPSLTEDFVSYCNILTNTNIENFYNNDLTEMSDFLYSKYGIDNFQPYNLFSNYGDMTLVYTSVQFQPKGNLFDRSFRFVGTSISGRAEDHSISFDKYSDKKLIYTSLGTLFNNDEFAYAFYNICFDAFKNESNYQVIMSVGNQTNIAEIKGIPDNFALYNHVPQLDVLKKTDLFITHGGMNSVNEALYFGVPMIAFPIGLDQPLVARQVENVNAGLMLSLNDLSPTELNDKSTQVLSNTIYKTSSEQIGHTLKTHEGYLTAAEEILQFKSKNQI